MYSYVRTYVRVYISTSSYVTCHARTSNSSTIFPMDCSKPHVMTQDERSGMACSLVLL